MGIRECLQFGQVAGNSERPCKNIRLTERNPIPIKSADTTQDDPRQTMGDLIFHAQKVEGRLHECAYCGRTATGNMNVIRSRSTLTHKSLCFNCAPADHKATECKSKMCSTCKRRDHFSICDSQTGENSVTAAEVNGDGPLAYPLVAVEVAGVNCRALLGPGAGSSHASATLIKTTGANLHHSGMR